MEKDNGKDRGKGNDSIVSPSMHLVMLYVGLHRVLASVLVSDQYQHFLVTLESVKHVIQVPILLLIPYMYYYNE